MASIVVTSTMVRFGFGDGVFRGRAPPPKAAGLSMPFVGLPAIHFIRAIEILDKDPDSKYVTIEKGYTFSRKCLLEVKRQLKLLN